MLPGIVAGEYEFNDIHVDLETLCAAYGVASRRGEATRLNADKRSVVLADGSVLAYEMRSLNVGSRPSLPEALLTGSRSRRSSSFAELRATLDASVKDTEGSIRLAVVGQGNVWVEVASELRRRLLHGCVQQAVEILLVGRSKGVMASRGVLARDRGTPQGWNYNGGTVHPSFGKLSLSRISLTFSSSCSADSDHSAASMPTSGLDASRPTAIARYPGVRCQ